jgi:peroxiredoxin Q/BCP
MRKKKTVARRSKPAKVTRPVKRAAATRVAKRKRPAQPRPKQKTKPRALQRAALAVGQPVPEVAFSTNVGVHLLSDYRGRHLVLYFYPKDDTPGCTLEGKDFRDHQAKLAALNAVVVGVSRDSLASHEKFCTKYLLPFELASDPDETLCRQFGVIREKTLYGRKYLGVDRSTFVIDKKGVLRKAFRGVKVAGHVEEVLAELKRL